MPKALITGAGGFVGPYLGDYLRSLGYEVWGTTLSEPKQSTERSLVQLDLRHGSEVAKVVQDLAPDEIYHLAAISKPTLGLVSEFYDVNLYGTLNILEAAQGIDAEVLVVSSAYVYGAHDHKMSERAPLRPVNHYGASKVAAEMAGLAYARQGLKVVGARPFNHTGPGQSTDFLIPSLMQQLARIEKGEAKPRLKLGNLDSVRDFSDVRDVVRAYHLLLQKGQSGEAYNVGSGQGASVAALVDKAKQLISTPVELSSEPARQRSTDIPYLVADVTRLFDLGWNPETSFESTLQDLLDSFLKPSTDRR